MNYLKLGPRSGTTDILGSISFSKNSLQNNYPGECKNHLQHGKKATTVPKKLILKGTGHFRTKENMKTPWKNSRNTVTKVK
ncbi:unnamed protein product [Rhizophagus irregularis]|nr:unnamed protein product [Rhizophagus irregularis]